MKELVILDLDNTVYEERCYFFKVFDEFEVAMGLERGILKKSFENLDRRKSSNILRDLLEGASINTEYNYIKLFDFYSSAAFSLDIPASSLDFIELLKKNQVSVAILTNGVPDVQKNKVKSLDLERVVDRVFYARDLGFDNEKPDIRCFQEVLAYFNCESGRAVMIGDSYENDYLGGLGAGMDSLWLGGYGDDAIANLGESLSVIFG